MPPLLPASVTSLPTFSFHHHAHPLSLSFREGQKSPESSCSCPLAQPLPHAQLTLLLLDFEAFFQHGLPDAGLHVSITTKPKRGYNSHFITVLQVNSQVFYSWDILTPNLSCVLIHTVYKPCSVCSLQKLLTGSCVTTLNHAYYKYRSAFPDPNKCRFVLHMITLL